jgi:hypothetical protein
LGGAEHDNFGLVKVDCHVREAAEGGEGLEQTLQIVGIISEEDNIIRIKEDAEKAGGTKSELAELFEVIDKEAEEQGAEGAALLDPDGGGEGGGELRATADREGDRVVVGGDSRDESIGGAQSPQAGP